jgi:hypothetical protein
MGKTRNTGFSNNAIQYNSGSIAFTSGSTTRMFISASGLVGIGTTNPTSRLSVSGSIESLIESTYEGGQLVLRGNTYRYNIDNYSGSLRFFRENDSDATAGVIHMAISSSGNVGIGTGSPDRLLQMYNTSGQTVFSIVGATNDSTDIFFGDTDNKAEAVIRFINGANTFNILQGGSTRMTITASGSVGIGTSSPSVRLDVVGSGGIRVNEDGSGTKVISIRSDFAGVDPAINVSTNNGLLLQTNNTERMRITSGGVVYVNTTSNPLPSNASPQFGVIAGAGTDAVNIKHTENGNNTLNLWQTGTSQHNAIAFYKGDSQTNRGNIVVTTSGTSYNSISDYRLKENIVPLENGLDRVLQLKPSKFNWIETGDESEGFIAHELQEYFPDAVTGEKDAVFASTGNIKAQSVDYGRITPLLVKAIQELKAENDALKTRIETLENK